MVIYNKNKKGEFLIDIITIFLVLIIYFSIYPVLDTVTQDLLLLNPDSFTSWFLRGTTFFILIGIIKFVLTITSISGGRE